MFNRLCWSLVKLSLIKILTDVVLYFVNKLPVTYIAFSCSICLYKHKISRPVWVCVCVCIHVLSCVCVFIYRILGFIFLLHSFTKKFISIAPPPPKKVYKLVSLNFILFTTYILKKIWVLCICCRIQQTMHTKFFLLLLKFSYFRTWRRDKWRHSKNLAKFRKVFTALLLRKKGLKIPLASVWICEQRYLYAQIA